MQRTQRAKDDFQTDALRPAALPTATFRPRGNEDQTIDQTSDEYLDGMYEEWNKKLDAEIEVLVEGMTELVKIASIGNKDKFKVAQEAFEAQCRTESMVRAATSLLSIIHSLKLVLLLSDEGQIAARRDGAAIRFQERAESARRVATESLELLLNKREGGLSSNEWSQTMQLS
ncbi:hypothetical protein FRC19_011379 [Serendipita sp. 401]|nr:hypothetical protein FRC19_011379 [Serendipita sp. 401]KAG9056344.1 hypothetical protein FS842_010921 [Serendipita sp. 407]